MGRFPRERGPVILWGSVFLLWGLFLSGVASEFIGSPGILQAVRLRSLHEFKKQELALLGTELGRLAEQKDALENNRIFQEREIRRVLGYAAPSEMIFDFNAGAPRQVAQGVNSISD